MGLRTHCEGRRIGPPRVALLLLAVLAAGTREAGAQQPNIDTPYRWIDRSMRAGLSPGYIFTGRGSLELGPGSTPTLAGRFRIRVGSPLSIGINSMYGGSDRFVVNPLAEGGPAVVDTVGSSWLLIELGVQFAFTGARTWHGVQPYILIGGGALFGLQNEVSPLVELLGLEPFVFKVGTWPSFLAGGGMEWLVSSRVGLGFEFRDHIWRIKTPDGFFDPLVLENIIESGAPAPQESQWTNNFELSLTLWFYL